MATTTRTPKTTGKTAAAVAKPTAKKPASTVKKPVATPLTKTVATKKPAAKATSKTSDKIVKSVPKQPKKISIPDAQRRHMIATAAYYLAAQRSFRGGCEMQDWLTAEMQIEAQLNSNS